MEKALVLLQEQGILIHWSDNNILPGRSISATIEQEMEQADIVAFLLSQDFLASPECKKEWKRAKTLEATTSRPLRIPIVVGHCAWRDFLADDDIKVLPEDGTPVTEFVTPDKPWMHVYDGIKSLVDKLRNDLSAKARFVKHLQSTDDVVSQRPSTLDDLFVFPPLSRYGPTSESETHELDERTISGVESLLRLGHVLVHGDVMSGKTALGRHIVLSLIATDQPALLVDLQEVKRSSDVDVVLAEHYRDQFHGDYAVWQSRGNKAIVLDNLSSRPAAVDFVAATLETFSNVIVLVGTDTYVSYYRDDAQLAKCTILQIRSLTHGLQEKLIRRRLALMKDTVYDGTVDQAEKRVNAIINTRILPRYPFYVLSILQTLEAFMPRDMTITSHGHCYYIFVVARLMKAGIPETDEAINVCLNFAERLAFTIYRDGAERREYSRATLGQFIADYKKEYVLPDYIQHRMVHRDGILTDDGEFRHPYMYYFFLGRYLATNEDDEILEQMCRNSHVAENHLTLLFVIHHATNDKIIEEIMIRTMCSLDEIRPARLDPSETKRFRSIVSGLPSNILSGRSVEAERRADREAIDHQAEEHGDFDDEAASSSHNREIYQVLKNNELLGQVLKVRYGRLKKQRIADIVEAVADGGLRLVNMLMNDEEDISDLVRYLHARVPELPEHRIKKLLQFMSFLWTMINVELVVNAVSHKEIALIVRDLVQQKNTPAYDVIGFFCALDSADELTPKIRRDLQELLNRHEDSFVKGVLSIRVQHYMNTHRSTAQIEQGICADLKIKYRHRIVAAK